MRLSAHLNYVLLLIQHPGFLPVPIPNIQALATILEVGIAFGRTACVSFSFVLALAVMQLMLGVGNVSPDEGISPPN
jgi:hypothetical protein